MKHLLLILLLFSEMALAKRGDILIQSRYSIMKMVEGKPLKIKEKELLSHTPEGRNHTILSKTCQAETLKKALNKPSLNHYQFSHILREHFKTCEKELIKGNGIPILKLLNIFGNLAENPNVKHVEFTFPGSQKIEALLAFKNDGIKRPLIIIKCGLSCRAKTNYSTLSVFTHLFEESPFNILLLASTSSTNYGERNGLLTLGGVEEGRHLIEVADLLMEESSPYKNLISSMHIMGFSLGGNGALFASIYDELNPPRYADKRFNSTLSMCPVVSLENAIRNFSGKGILKPFFAKKLRELGKRLSPISPFMRELFENNKKPKLEDIHQGLFLANLEGYKKLSRNGVNALKPFKTLPFQSIEENLFSNNFENFSHLVKKPLLIIASKDDPLVHYNQNTKLLLNKHRNAKESMLQILTLKDGSHCAYSFAYNWKTMSTIAREYFLKNSPEFNKKRKLISVPFVKNVVLKKGEVHISQEWDLKKNRQIELIFKIFKSNRFNQKCNIKRPYQSDSSCYRKQIVKINLNNMPKSIDFNLSQIGDKQIFNRFLNTRVFIVNKNGLSLNGKK